MPSKPESRKILSTEIQLHRRIGAGAFGGVYLAEPIPNRSKSFPYPPSFVVKVIKESANTASYSEAVSRELGALAKLSHPCIVSYIGTWVEATKGPYYGSYCLAMQYCNGGDLHQYMCRVMRSREQQEERKFVPVEVISKIIVSVFSALNYSHSQHVIHRDIKPGNIFLNVKNDGSIQDVLIGDYGLARPVDETLQMVVSRVGTPCYLSPEIVSGISYTNKTDIFSAGATLFELMTFERPFWRKDYTDAQTFSSIINHDPLRRLFNLTRGKYPISLVKIVAACLSKPEKLRPSAYQVLSSFCPNILRAVSDAKLPLIADNPIAASGRRNKSPPPAPDVSEEKAADPVKKLAECMQLNCAEALDPELSSLTKGTNELFLLIKVIMLSHRQNPDRLKTILPRVIHQVDPHVSERRTTKIIELVCPSTSPLPRSKKT